MAEPPPAIIDQHSVWQTLKALRDGTPPTAGRALPVLQLVQNLIEDERFPGGPDERIYALQQVLIRAITQCLSQQRYVLHLPPPTANATLTEVEVAIARDGQTHNPELIGWSWLYASCVRVDLQITPHHFCRLIHVQPRTLRRYQRRALFRLTSHLIAAEQQARSRQQASEIE